MNDYEMNETYRWFYHSVIGEMVLLMDETYLYGIWFIDQKHYPKFIDQYPCDKTRLTDHVCQWLDQYFNGLQPIMDIPCHPMGTPFQRSIWDILLTIPYGCTMSYGQITQIYIKQHGLATMSAQAVGQAVGHNPISILIPCHRVLGKNREITGYAGGIERKRFLLDLEGIAYKKEKHG